MFFPHRILAEEFPRALLEEAVRKGQPIVVIPPGTYRLTPAYGHTVVVKDAHDLTIIAKGVTLIGTELVRALTFDHCKNVTLDGLIVDYDPLPFTQGVVTQIAADFNSIDIAIDDGYPRQPYSRIDICDPKTRYRKRGVPFLWGTQAAMIDAKTVRVTLHDIGKSAVIGDPVSLSTGSVNGPPHAVTVDSCSGMVFRDVAVYSAPGMGIIESDGDGGMKYLHCRIVPGPKPPGATAERLLSTSWDALQTKTTKHGPTVEDCEIRSAGDDSWSVQSSDFVVVSVEGSKAVLAFRDPYCAGPQPGDRIATSLASSQVTVTAAHIVDLAKINLSDDIRANLLKGSSQEYWRVGARATEITFTGTFPFAVGDSVYCPDRQCNGFVFRNNRLHSPGRILVKASDGLIENNLVDGGHSAISITPEVPETAAGGMANIIIRHNTFTGTGYFCPLWNSPQAGSISITADGPHDKFRPVGFYQNMVIEDNRFDDICGSAIVATSTRGLTIRRNTFCRMMTVKPDNTGGRFGVDENALIWLDQCEQVKLHDNRVYQPGAFLKDLVAGLAGDQAVIERAQAGIRIETGKNCPGR